MPPWAWSTKKGNLVQFTPVGMDPDEVKLLEHPPVGRGLIGALMREGRTIRVPDISLDPRSVGFPPNHPPMSTFLGVPIRLGDRQLGQIYLTDKQDYPIFTETDERVIETLAAYAAVAITNARLYEGVVNHEELCQRNDDLALSVTWQPR
jgi:GAF domain-containing protein